MGTPLSGATVILELLLSGAAALVAVLTYFGLRRVGLQAPDLVMAAVFPAVWVASQLDLRYVVGLPLATAATLLGRLALRKLLHHTHHAGCVSHRGAALGDRQEAIGLIRTVWREPHAGFLPVGVCMTNPAQRLDEEGRRVQVAGGLREVKPALWRLGVSVAACGAWGVSTEGLRRPSWEPKAQGPPSSSQLI